MVKETEFYELLGVAVDAADNDIKRAYRKLALKYHPDKNPGDDAAADMFKKVSEAYECLSDSEKRGLYDKFGKKGMEEGGSGGFHDPSDIFSMFFGGGRREQGEPKPKDIVHELAVSLEDMYNGKTRKIAVMRDRLCQSCTGTGVKGGKPKVKCTTCRGQGAVIRMRQLGPGMMQQVQMKCPECKGSGDALSEADKCLGCSGNGVTKDRKVLEVVIKKGAKKGDHERFAGEGDQTPDIKQIGDVLILIAQKPHDLFRRVGTHLFINHDITLKQALCGFDLPIQHLDARHIVVRIPKGQCIDPNFAWTVNREGMALPDTGGSQRGNLVIHFNVVIPEMLPESAISGIREVLNGTTSFPKVANGQRVALSDYVPKKAPRGPMRRQMPDDDDDDDDSGGRSGGRPGGQGVECQQQ